MSGYLKQLKLKKPETLPKTKKVEEEVEFEDIDISDALEQHPINIRYPTAPLQTPEYLFNSPSTFSVMETPTMSLTETQMVDVHTALITQISAYRRSAANNPEGKTAAEMRRIELLKRIIDDKMRRLQEQQEQQLEAAE